MLKVLFLYLGRWIRSLVYGGNVPDNATNQGALGWALLSLLWIFVLLLSIFADTLLGHIICLAIFIIISVCVLLFSNKKRSENGNESRTSNDQEVK